MQRSLARCDASSETMRIAQIAPLYEAVPPRLYGGTERVVAYLADALVELGHDVTLFASGDSSTRATLCAMRRCAIRLDPAVHKSDVAAHLSMLHEVRARAHEFDVIHNHLDLLAYPFFEGHAARVLTTLHGRLDIEDLLEPYRRWPEFPLVSISDAQRRPLPDANWIATVHHGVPHDLLVPGPGDGGYVAFVGRISPEKRLDRAIAIAQRTGVPLRVAAKVDPADRRYFHAEIEPLLPGPGVAFLGEVDNAGKQALLGHARALLFPVDWPEPFGLVMIEAMACGTPVIAWNCGSVPEVVEHGVTGFIVESEDEAVQALGRVAELDRARVRATFERRFSAVRMARGYVAVYERMRAAARAEARTETRAAAHTHADPPAHLPAHAFSPASAHASDPGRVSPRAVDGRRRDLRDSARSTEARDSRLSEVRAGDGRNADARAGDASDGRRLDLPRTASVPEL
jgi:glycosyltransferase involved in cell wall biosynthesis